jgi:hypothetical protein
LDGDSPKSLSCRSRGASHIQQGSGIVDFWSCRIFSSSLSWNTAPVSGEHPTTAFGDVRHRNNHRVTFGYPLHARICDRASSPKIRKSQSDGRFGVLRVTTPKFNDLHVALDLFADTPPLSPAAERAMQEKDFTSLTFIRLSDGLAFTAEELGWIAVEVAPLDAVEEAASRAPQRVRFLVSGDPRSLGLTPCRARSRSHVLDAIEHPELQQVRQAAREVADCIDAGFDMAAQSLAASCLSDVINTKFGLRRCQGSGVCFLQAGAGAVQRGRSDEDPLGSLSRGGRSPAGRGGAGELLARQRVIRCQPDLAATLPLTR